MATGIAGRAQFVSKDSRAGVAPPRPVLAADAVQSLELALQYARATLLPLASKLTWLGTPGELFLPLSVPGYLPPAAQKRIERSIDLEVRRIIAARRKRAKRSRRRTNP
jgi:hypothetical protein